MYSFISAKLGELRNSWLMVFAVSNTLWMVLIYTLADQGKLLSVFGSNPVGKSYLSKHVCSMQHTFIDIRLSDKTVASMKNKPV